MKNRRWLWAVLLAVLLLALFVFAASAENSLAATGSCGENVTWSFDSNTGALTISGEGDMADYNLDNSPFLKNTEIKSLTISNGVTRIGDRAFNACTRLTSVMIPDSVVSIGDRAFYDCHSLMSVTIPDSVTSIESYAFAYCNTLTSAMIPDNVTSIGHGLFSGCSSLNSIQVGENNPNYFSDDSGALYERRYYNSTYDSSGSQSEYCNELKYILLQYPSANEQTAYHVIDETIQIESYAFDYTKYLEEVVVPKDVRYCWNSSFFRCDGLQRIIVDGENEYFASDEFGCLYNKEKTKLIRYPTGNKRVSFEIPAYVKEIGSYAFYDCQFLYKVIIPGTMDRIHNQSFYKCTSIRELVVLEGVTTLEMCCFSACNNLESVSLPDTVTTIGGWAFEWCLNLKTVSLSANIEQIGEAAFNQVEYIEVDDSNPFYSSEDGVLFNKDKTVLLQYPGGNRRSSYSIPEGVSTISEEAFYYAMYLETLNMPESLKTIESIALLLPGVTTVEFPNTVESIGMAALAECFMMNRIVVKGMNTVLEPDSLGLSECRYTENELPEEKRIMVTLAYILSYYIVPTDDIKEYLDNIEMYIDDDLTGAEMYIGTIYCHAGSTAEAYAQETGMDYELVHFYDELVSTTAPTCTEKGYTTYKCIHCDATENRDFVDPLDHDYIDHDAKAPTCTAIGWDAYQTCSRCNYTSYEEKAPLGHDYIDHVAQAPTCTAIGWDAYQTCSRCDYTSYVEKAANGHTEVVDPAVAATCTETGLTEGKHCSVCTEVLVAQQVVPAHGHEFVLNEIIDPNCTEDGQRIYICKYDSSHKQTETIPALGHVDAGNDGHCDRCGAQMTGGDHCNYCGQIHGGAFGWLVKFFHSILAFFKR